LGEEIVELDAEQLYVVDSDKSMMCIAGPGSGKTRVLTEKARGLFNGGLDILCLTFTRAAAAEMAERVPGLPATTIHSYCCGSVGWQLPKGASQDDGYSYLLQRFLWWQQQNPIYYDWILIDECQDLNPMEMDVALSLVGDKIFAVGDPFQSIYGFQGALGPSVMTLLERCGCSTIPLHNNYRSCVEIVDTLNSLYPRGLISKNITETGWTAVLCRRNDDLFEASRFLERRGIPHRVRLAAQLSDKREYDVIEDSHLILMTVHSSKGHEFDRVILYNWVPNKAGEETRVYYVAIARASKEFIYARSLSSLGELLNGG
jgi:superfamily I DNA/RNA helicase